MERSHIWFHVGPLGPRNGSSVTSVLFSTKRTAIVFKSVQFMPTNIFTSKYKAWWVVSLFTWSDIWGDTTFFRRSLKLYIISFLSASASYCFKLHKKSPGESDTDFKQSYSSNAEEVHRWLWFFWSPEAWWEVGHLKLGPRNPASHQPALFWSSRYDRTARHRPWRGISRRRKGWKGCVLIIKTPSHSRCVFHCCGIRWIWQFA